MWWSVLSREVLGSLSFIGLSVKVAEVAEALARLGRGRGEWGGHEGCQASKCGMSGGRESLGGGRMEVAMVVSAVRARRPPGRR